MAAESVTRRVLILGSSGSIGTQAVEIVTARADLETVGVAVGRDWRTAVTQARSMGLETIAVADPQAASEARENFDGNVLEATGWQDLCTKFHRVHPVTSRNCTESDLALAGGLAPGQFADYHCRNGLRDVVTPLYIRGRHVGNIFTGQFFYDDDEVDEADFAARAREHGFDVDAYMEAFRRIPRYSRETIAHLNCLIYRGEVQARPGPDGVTLYSLTA